MRQIDVCSSCRAPLPCFCSRRWGSTPKPMSRWRSEKFLAFVRRLPCSVEGCCSISIEAAHFGPRGVGTKVHDCLAVPLCTEHHRAQHAKGKAWEHDGEVTRWQLATMAAYLITAERARGEEP